MASSTISGMPAKINRYELHKLLNSLISSTCDAQTILPLTPFTKSFISSFPPAGELIHVIHIEHQVVEQSFFSHIKLFTYTSKRFFIFSVLSIHTSIVLFLFLTTLQKIALAIKLLQTTLPLLILISYYFFLFSLLHQ